MKWVEVLNQAVSWSDFETASGRALASGGLKAAEHARLVADAALLQRLFAASYLNRAVAALDQQRLLQWLTTVTPSVLVEPGNGGGGLNLLGERRHQPLPAPFEAALTGALLQFLATVSEPALFASVHRCQGVRREAAAVLLPADVEQRFAEHAGLQALLGSEPTGPVLSQCSKLIFSPRGRRFCSKSCSNANFAARKAQKDPQYFAEKQERYRSRQRQVEEPASEAARGAFVYID